MNQENKTVSGYLIRRIPLIIIAIVPVILASLYLHSISSMLEELESSSSQESTAQVSTQPQWTPENSLRTAIAPEFLDTGDTETLVSAIERGLTAVAKLPDTYAPTCGSRVCTKALLNQTLTRFKNLVLKYGISPELYTSLASEFDILESQAPSVLFTGYFQSSLKGSRTKTAEYDYPIYRVPDDLIAIDTSAYNSLKDKGLPNLLMGRLSEKKVIPYFSRDEIDFNAALANRGLEIVWVNDSVAAFFMHIQGSAVVELNDGNRIQVGYASKNGHPYRPIGKWLIDNQIMKKEDVSMQNIMKYLYDHPDAQRDIYRYNPSYVFFQEYAEGPIGAANVPIVGGRSIATDLSLFPKGGLAYIETEAPSARTTEADPIEWKRYQRFMVNLDTGGAIRGADRVDIFTGYGEEAELMAGPLNRRGKLFFLVAKE